MKKKLLISSAFIFQLMHGQTNNFPIPTGNVSIGAPSGVATSKLHVLDNTALGNGQNVARLITQIGGNSGTAAVPANNLTNNLWLVRGTNGDDWWTAAVHDALSLDNAFNTPRTDTKTYWERHAFEDRQTWGTGANPYMTLLAGRTGIGIFDPEARLDLEENDNNFAVFIARNRHNAGGGYGIVSNVIQNSTRALAVINSSNGWSENFLVYGDGRTEIGGMSQVSGPHASALLHVNGKIVAKEIIVTTQNWADYVFAPDYKLRPLTELEKFYREYQHLPDVPCEQDVIENGINTAAMDVVLLKKIEELTLYIVEQQKISEKQQLEIELLKQTIK